MPKSDSQRERRARILAIASELFRRYGYDKTTMSDVADEVGVSKGTIYQHFDSKDELFESILLQSISDYSRDWMASIESDPEGGTIGGIYRNILRALEDHELVAGMLKRDERLLGSYLHREDSLLNDPGSGGHREAFVRAMQKEGLMRCEIEPDVLAHIMDIFSYGLVGIREHKEAEEIPPLEKIIEGIAVLFDGALTPEDADPQTGKRILETSLQNARADLDDPQNGEEE